MKYLILLAILCVLIIFFICFVFTMKTFKNFNVFEQIFSIGMYFGKDIMNLRPCDNIHNPVLTAVNVSDREAEFVADPFVLKDNGEWYMFFEVFDKKIGRGIISAAVSKDLYKWQYIGVVLEEEFHLSYPYVFKYDNEFYMLPEGGQSGYLSLYKASAFPYKWEKVSSLLRGNYTDSSIFKYDGMWWMFNEKKEGNRRKNDNLHLYYSHSLEGDWREHPKSPIVSSNAKISRPAGRVIVEADNIIRFAQDDSEYYGKSIQAFRIQKLTTSEYEEIELGTVLEGSGVHGDWNRSGMHHIDTYKAETGEYIAFVDGLYNRKYNAVIESQKNKVRRLIRK